jgi:hypothetical protein
MPDVRLAQRAQHGIGDGVREHIGVRVPIQPVRVRNFHTSEYQWASFGKAVYIVSNPYHAPPD